MIYGSQSEDMDEKTVFEKINPAVRLFCLLFLTVSYILAHSFSGHLFAFVFLLTLLYLSQLDLSVITSAIKRLFPLLLFVSVLNFCFSSPKTAFFRWWVLAPSVPGALRGLLISIKIVEIVVIFDMFNAMTEPMSLVSTLSAVFRPLALFKVEYEQIAIMIASSFLFFDDIKKRAEEIMLLGRYSGADRTEGSRRFDSTGKLRVLLPVLYESFIAARERAFLMDARGIPAYLRSNTKLPAGITFYDYCAMTVCAAFFAFEMIVF